MRVLFIGGTGVISRAAAERCVAARFDLTVCTRGRSVRPLPEGVTVLTADWRDEATAAALAGQRFDAVVDFIAFTEADIERDLHRLRGKVGQFVFISSASAYQTPPERLPVTEATPLSNPFWAYSRDKIACEERLMRAWREETFPVTIVRPSHTYDETMIPLRGGYTAIDRMRRGAPVIIHGDGTSLWTLTHTRDVAVGLVGLLGRTEALGEAFHITGNEWLSWNRIAELLAEAAGATARIVHVPSTIIARYDPDWGASLLGDKAHSMIFDNSRIAALVPGFAPSISFRDGAVEIVRWFDGDAGRRTVDPGFDALCDRLAAARERMRPQPARPAPPPAED